MTLAEILKIQSELEAKATPGEHFTQEQPFCHSEHAGLAVFAGGNHDPHGARLVTDFNVTMEWDADDDDPFAEDRANAALFTHLRNHAAQIRADVLKLVEALKYYADGWHYRLTDDSTIEDVIKDLRADLNIETGDKARAVLNELGFGGGE